MKQQQRRRPERTLRIIAGQWRGRKFRFPDSDSQIRPTPDRVRETLFNWLQSHTEGARCLDLYAGSGALGLEALSRGAAAVVFVEQQRLVADALRGLLSEWQAPNAQVIRGEARAYLSAPAASAAREPFDLIFLDPPYAASRTGELQAALALLSRGWLKSGARVYVEQARADPPLAVRDTTFAGPYMSLRTGVAGEVRYHLLAADAAGGMEAQ
jgi:16S rRNA (guanine966-N2)-methyltransferase